MSAQFATRVGDEQGQLFRAITHQLGTTSADAMRVFISAFNAHHGFPFEVRLKREAAFEPFQTEDEALDFSDNLARMMADEAW